MGLARGGPDDSSFAAASDPERMRVVLERHLPRPGGPPATVLRCAIELARRGEGRSLFQYRASLRDPAGGPDRPLDVTAVSYGGRRTRRAWDRIRSAPPAPPLDGLGLAAAAYVPELDLLLQVFPFDHQLPALAPLLAGPWPPLADALQAGFGPGAWRFEGWETEVARYRVDLRATLRLAVRASEAESGATAERRFFVKVYGTPALAAGALAAQRGLEAVLAAGDGTLAVAPTAAWLPDERVLAQEAVSGRGLVDALGDPSHAEEALRRTARAVAALHTLAVPAPAQQHEQDRSGPERVRRAAERVRAARPDLAGLVAEVEAGILSGLAACDALQGVPVHGDLKPAHVLLGADRVTLIDFDKFAEGEPMLDVVAMARNIRQGRRVLRGEDSGALARAFVEEYFAAAPAGWARRLPPHYAAALLTEAAAVGRNVRGAAADRPRRPKHGGRADVPLEEARDVLAGRVW